MTTLQCGMGLTVYLCVQHGAFWAHVRVRRRSRAFWRDAGFRCRGPDITGSTNGHDCTDEWIGTRVDKKSMHQQTLLPVPPAERIQKKQIFANTFNEVSTRAMRKATREVQEQPGKRSQAHPRSKFQMGQQETHAVYARIGILGLVVRVMGHELMNNTIVILEITFIHFAVSDVNASWLLTETAKVECVRPE